jgi:hypothetical protein
MPGYCTIVSCCQLPVLLKKSMPSSCACNSNQQQQAGVAAEGLLPSPKSTHGHGRLAHAVARHRVIKQHNEMQGSTAY